MSSPLPCAAQQQSTAQRTAEILQQFASGHGASLINRPIVLFRVRVLKTPGAKVNSPKNMGPSHTEGFFAGQTLGRGILVTLSGGLVPVDANNVTAKIKVNEIVDVTGTAQPVPDDVQLKALYHLTGSEIDQVKREGAIVEAGSVIVMKK
jgi:hypothetical protein